MGEVRAAEVRVVEPRKAEVRAVEVRAGEVRAAELRTAEVRAGKARAGEERADGDIPRGAAGEVRAADVRVGEVRAAEVNWPEVAFSIPAPDHRDSSFGGRARTVGEFLAIERPLLRPLPEEPFETGLWLTPRVDRFAQVMVRNNRYSVPVRLIGRRVRVLLHASDLVIYDGRAVVARHERLPGRAGARLDLDHYLEALVRKPGALPGATALEQARAAGKFTPVHDAWWAAARKAHGDAAGTRALVEVLLLHRHMDGEHVVAGLAAALRAGALTADAVTSHEQNQGPQGR